jgi:UDP-glucose 4-epimerase
MMKTILVTGGAGFIGSHVNLLLNEAGYKTVVFDNLSRGNEKAVIAGSFVEGDLLDENSLDLLFKNYNIEAVLHFAALIDVGESLEKPLAYYRNNVQGTLNLLNAMGRAGVNKLLFSSTAALYGFPEQDLITETHPLKPINPYGRTKLAIEYALADIPLTKISLRYFNAAGGDPHGILKNFKSKESNLIPIMLRSLKKGEPLQVFGDDYPTPDGTCLRDYIHVHDLGTAHLLALGRLNEGVSGVFNLGNGQGFSVKEVIETGEKVLKRKIPYKVVPRRPGDPPRLVADSAKAKKELGWRPEYGDLGKIILDAWNALP